MSKVWLISGASRGLGRIILEATLEAGNRRCRFRRGIA